MIDAHHHLWDQRCLSYAWWDAAPALFRHNYTADALKQLLDEVGVGGAVVVQTLLSMQEARWLLALADQHPFITGVVAGLDVTDARLGAALDVLQAHPRFCGLRHGAEIEPDPDWLVRADTVDGLRELARRGIPFDLLVRPAHLRHVLSVQEKVPDLRMVVDHFAKPDIKGIATPDWAQQMRRVAECPTTYCKVSAGILEDRPADWQPSELRPFVETVAQAFGYSRLIWGSNWPVCLASGSYGRVYSGMVEAMGALDEPTRGRVFGDNARAFYRL